MINILVFKIKKNNKNKLTLQNIGNNNLKVKKNIYYNFPNNIKINSITILMINLVLKMFHSNIDRDGQKCFRM